MLFFDEVSYLHERVPFHLSDLIFPQFQYGVRVSSLGTLQSHNDFGLCKQDVDIQPDSSIFIFSASKE